MKFNFILMNPPYNKLGPKITRRLIEEVDFGYIVNLMPANNYRRYEKDFKLYRFVDINSIKVVRAGFKNAAVTTMMCKVNKERSVYLSEDEFEIENYTDKSLKKYFYENRKREHYAIDNAIFYPRFEQFEKTSIAKSIYIGCRVMGNLHLPYSLESITNRYNMNRITKEQVIAESAKSEQARGIVGKFYIINFDSENEKTNFSNFIYSKDGFRFISKIFTALNVDGSIQLSKFMPKTEWTKQQTVQSILKDYGYTSTEIQEVIDDLKNFKGMDNE